MQEEIIQSVLNRKDTLALLPTAGGKSLCYQLPALMSEGLCIVITPLIALMKDQVTNLEKRNIPALVIHSGMTFFEVKKTLQHAAYGGHKFLYLSPERLETNLFKEYLPALPVNLIAVDEAHCISQWGYDFRPPYLRISNLREELPDVPVLALTASATPRVQNDILDKLQFKDYNIFKQSYERTNLSYSVFKVDSKINKVIDILKNVKGSSIVYCRNRRQTKEVAQLLHFENISAEFYHAGLTQEERNKKQIDWVSDETRVIVCTNAFGMGIDKPNVRTVIHYDVPDCLENYYQEAGRAGRDEQRAFAVLLYQQQALQELEELPFTRFPSLHDIKKVYQALADYLHIPVGIGADIYYDFDLNEFIKNFHLNVHLVMNVLKVLEQEGHLTFNENIFLPSQVGFKIDKELLYEFERTHSDLEPVIKCLLRTYEGILDNRVSVFEKQMAKLLRTTDRSIKDRLKQLTAFGIIEYLPQKETPQIHFLLNRAPSAFLTVNHDAYSQRKKQFEARVRKMVEYLGLQHRCRSRFIASYFGDDTAKPCGVCDNCLSEKNVQTSGAEFELISKRIFDCIIKEGIDVKELILKLNDFSKKKLWKVLNYLQQERKIHINDVGFVTIADRKS